MVGGYDRWVAFVRLHMSRAFHPNKPANDVLARISQRFSRDFRQLINAFAIVSTISLHRPGHAE
jgi:hypothetical protein